MFDWESYNFIIFCGSLFMCGAVVCNFLGLQYEDKDVATTRQHFLAFWFFLMASAVALGLTNGVG